MPSKKKRPKHNVAIGFGANYSHNMGPTRPSPLNTTNNSSALDAYRLVDTPWNNHHSTDDDDWDEDDGDEEDELVQIATTATSSLFRTKSGKVFGCGTLHGKVRPHLTRTIIQLPLKCVELAAGRHFGLAKMEGGLAVCAWGAGHFGQLGLGPDSAPCVEHPTVIEALLPHVVGSPVSSLAAGYWHAMAATEAGLVFGWGCNRNAQCGVKPTKDPPTICSPQLVQFDPLPMASTEGEVEPPQPPKMTKIAAGRSHSVALSENGSLYCWGACQYGQCGILSRRRGGVAPPKHVESLAEVTIVDISAGDAHTLALTGGGRVFAWGAGMEGQLGTGSIVQMNPRPKLVGDVDFVAIEAAAQEQQSQKKLSSSSTLESFDSPGSTTHKQVFQLDPSQLQHVPKITSIHATGNCSMATSSSGHVYVWGCNDVGNLGVVAPPQENMTYADPGLPAPMAKQPGNRRQYHTHSFDSSHNIALPHRLEALEDYDISSIAASPTFMWCIGTKRTVEERQSTMIGYTLYEVQEGKRNANHNQRVQLLKQQQQQNGNSVKSHPSRRKSDTTASSTDTTSMETSRSMDPPEIKNGRNMTRGHQQVHDPDYGYNNNNSHSQSDSRYSEDDGNSSLMSEGLMSPTVAESKSKRIFSMKKISKMVRRSSLGSSHYHYDQDSPHQQHQQNIPEASDEDNSEDGADDTTTHEDAGSIQSPNTNRKNRMAKMHSVSKAIGKVGGKVGKAGGKFGKVVGKGGHKVGKEIGKVGKAVRRSSIM